MPEAHDTMNFDLGLLLASHSPRIDWYRIDKADEDNGWALAGNLSNIEHHFRLFYSAVLLCDFSEEASEAARLTNHRAHFIGPPQSFCGREWEVLAGREGGLSLHAIGVAIKQACSLIGAVVYVREVVDAKAAKEARRCFEKTFPGNEKMRHTIAHPEYYPNPEKNMRSDVPVLGLIGFGGANVRENFIGRRLTSSIDGDLVSFELSLETVGILKSIIDKLFEALMPMDPSRFEGEIDWERMKPPIK